MRTPHLKSIKAVDTPDATSSNDAGRIPVLGDDGHIANGFLDVDLEALGNNSTNGLLTRTGSGTVAARTITGPAAGISVSNGDGVSGNPTLALANDLAAYEGLSTTGLVVRTGDGTATTRTLTAPAAGITVSNGSGVSGNPTLALANDLAAYEGLSATGLVARTGDGTAAARTLTSATTDSLTISDAGGVAGNPTFRIDSTLDALAAANWVANAIPIGSGADTVAQVSFAANTFPARASTGDLVAKTITDFGLSLVDDANAAAGRTTLGLGTAAVKNTGASGDAVPLLNVANTWSATQTFKLDSNANWLVISENTTNDTASLAGFRTVSDTAIQSFQSHASARTTARFGETLGGWNEFFSFAGNGLIVGTFGAVPLVLGTNSAMAVKIDSSQVTTIAKMKSTTYTVATLPTGAAGMRVFVTDATATTFASVVAGGGANGVPVYHDGTNWRIG